MVKQPEVDSHKLMYHSERVVDWLKEEDSYPISKVPLICAFPVLIFHRYHKLDKLALFKPNFWGKLGVRFR